jgi:glycine cleavage system H protein
MNIPSELKYVKSHEWLNYLEPNRVRIGISDFAQKAMGDIVFINLPQLGDPATAGEPLCDVESVKSVEDIFSPVSGEITAINEKLLDHPELINADPYDAWIVEVSEVTATEEILSAMEYEAFCEQEG